MSFLNQITGIVKDLIDEKSLNLQLGPIVLYLYTPNSKQYQIGKSVTLHTHLIWREDSQTLYGFSSLSERELFLSLLKVRTLGPKLALTILSWDRKRFFQACQHQDKSELTSIPGIGPKMAIKILQELSLKDHEFFSDSILTNDFHDFKAALNQLGFQRQQIFDVYENLDHQMTLEEKIRSALKVLGDQHVRTARV
jgi:Holliday junction DNA helicase RuvA